MLLGRNQNFCILLVPFLALNSLKISLHADDFFRYFIHKLSRGVCLFRHHYILPNLTVIKNGVKLIMVNKRSELVVGRSSRGRFSRVCST